MILKKQIAPLYTDREQVRKIVEDVMAEQGAKIALVITIGHNGEKFVSSTDWMVEFADKTRCLLPIYLVPEYQTFITVRSGTEYRQIGKAGLEIHCDPESQEKPSVVVLPDGSAYEFTGFEELHIPVPLECPHVIASDCEVILQENAYGRYYKIINNENSNYASYYGGVITIK